MKHAFLEKEAFNLGQTARVFFNDVQNIRNKLVHHNGFFPIQNNEAIIERIMGIKELELVTTEGSLYCEVKIKKITYVLGLYPDFNDLFTKLFWLVEAKMGYPIFIKNLGHLFGFVFKAQKVTIHDVKVCQSIYCVIETTDPVLQQMDCKIT